jgi:hypothetical protein
MNVQEYKDKAVEIAKEPDTKKRMKLLKALPKEARYYVRSYLDIIMKEQTRLRCTHWRRGYLDGGL